MKKLLLILVLGLGLTTYAQHHEKSKMEQMTPEQRQKAHLDKMTKELKLNASQQDQVSKLMAENGTKMSDLKAQKEALNAKGSAATAAEKDALKKQMMDAKTDYEAKMK